MDYEAVDRHAAPGDADEVALRRVARDGSVSTVPYAEPALGAGLSAIRPSER
ncbi:hypothetical protein ACLQ18_42810 [Streptomyces sp. DT193]|uniref:hypothetical protein n=1 Tax=Streptomyces sp. DT193 TaxID=3393418 RepID=UPI003CF9988F